MKVVLRAETSDLYEQELIQLLRDSVYTNHVRFVGYTRAQTTSPLHNNQPDNFITYCILTIFENEFLFQ